LDLVGYTPDRRLSSMTAVEPSVGSGAFWVPMVERLLASADPATEDLTDALRGYDVQAAHVETCKKESIRLLTDAGLSIREAERISESWLRTADFLLDGDVPSADFVIGNPPYIRSDELDQEAEV